MVSMSREREALIIDNFDLVVVAVSRIPRGCDPEEFYSIAQTALVVAANLHDLSLPTAAFRCYARHIIRREFISEFRRRRRVQQLCGHEPSVEADAAMLVTPAELAWANDPAASERTRERRRRVLCERYI